MTSKRKSIKTVWHTKLKRHYEVVAETNKYYYVYSRTDDATQRMLKSFFAEQKHSYMVTLRVTTSPDDIRYTVLTTKSLDEVRTELYNTLNDPNQQFIRLNNMYYNTDYIAYIGVK